MLSPAEAANGIDLSFQVTSAGLEDTRFARSNVCWLAPQRLRRSINGGACPSHRGRELFLRRRSIGCCASAPRNMLRTCQNAWKGNINFAGRRPLVASASAEVS